VSTSENLKLVRAEGKAMNRYNPSKILFSIFRNEHPFSGIHWLRERLNKLESRDSTSCKCNGSYIIAKAYISRLCYQMLPIYVRLLYITLH